MGSREDTPLVLGGGLIVGSKAIGVFGNVCPQLLSKSANKYHSAFSFQLSVHGAARPTTWTRLERGVWAGNSTIQLPEGDITGWRAGDQIVIAPSGYDPSQSEIRTITSIDGGMLYSRNCTSDMPICRHCFRNETHSLTLCALHCRHVDTCNTSYTRP